ncbi:hypothetical protein CVT24_008929 [Panaeolus cyanescens]|uniref:CxC5 like cysteine cluster associated with KDZ domain-containing protein n=1 Tax=Panaeolus cyanescens TaxID=181874 RepID=A0A409WEH6_9AGAR|nr:hypothetical protein CVT24_008929 [Panaeolus cyanescens]
MPRIPNKLPPWMILWLSRLPAKSLPDAITAFLGDALNMTAGHVRSCWDAFREASWNYDKASHSALADAKLFYEMGQEYGIGLRSKRKIVLYTLEDGACATYHYKLTCAACRTTYHNNYSVKDRIRTYYGGVPDAIEVGKHQFVSKNVANMFMSLMLISWTSATNNAEVYNSTISKPENQPDDWGFSFDLPDNALKYPTAKKKKIALHCAQVIQERNRLFDENGQPEWAHYCEKCVRFFNGSDGKPESYIRAIVALANKRHRFCPQHEYLTTICSVEGCSEPVVIGTLACNKTEHVQMYSAYTKRRTAHFQRKRGKTRVTSTAKPPDDDILTNKSLGLHLEPVHDDEDLIEDEALETLVLSDAEMPGDACPQKVDTGVKQLRARFGRRQTHSEQFMVHPCGIIVARATFYGSETVPQTVDMLKQVFRTPGSMPEYFIYDNCCGVYNHLQATDDPLLDKIGCPVDVFHFDCKHKKTDVICQQHCDPRKFPELIDSEGKWYFNTYICEQHNSWLRGYQAIFREMNGDKYNFILDELVIRKNRALLKKLAHNGHVPSYIPGLRYTR